MAGFDIVQAAAAGGQAILRGGGQVVGTVGGAFQQGIGMIGGGIAQLGAMVQGAITGQALSQQLPDVRQAAAGYPGGMTAMQAEISAAQARALAAESAKKGIPKEVTSITLGLVPGLEQAAYGQAELKELEQTLRAKGLSQAQISATLKAAQTEQTTRSIFDIGTAVALLFGVGIVHQKLTKAAALRGEIRGVTVAELEGRAAVAGEPRVTGFFTERPTRILGSRFDIPLGTAVMERPAVKVATAQDYGIFKQLGGEYQVEMASRRLMFKSYSELNQFEKARLVQLAERETALRGAGRLTEVKVETRPPVPEERIAPRMVVVTEEKEKQKAAVAVIPIESRLTKKQLVMVGLIAANLGVSTAVLLNSYLGPTVINNVITQTTMMEAPPGTTTTTITPGPRIPGFPALPAGGGGGGVRERERDRLRYYNELQKAYANVFGGQLAPHWRKSVVL